MKELQPKYISTYADRMPDSSFQLSVNWIEDAKPDWPLHAHEFAEIEILLSGHGVHLTEDGEIPIYAGDVFVVYGNTIHGYQDRKDYEMANVQFNPTQFLNFDADITDTPGYHALFVLEPQLVKRHKFRAHLHLPPGELSKVSQLLNIMTDELESKPSGYQSYVRSLFTQLVCILCRNYTERVRPSSRRLLKVSTAIRYIHENYDDHITLEDLASKIEFSVNQFIRVFKDATGYSPMDYIIRHRVVRAADMLKEGTPKIARIAQETGFSDSSHFCRHFKRILHMTPTQYKKRHSHLSNKKRK